MDCNEAEELIAPYLLGGLDSKERALLEPHLKTCPTCGRSLREAGDAVVGLAMGVPQLEAPPHIKQRLIARIEAEARSGRLTHLVSTLARVPAGLGRALMAHPVRAAAPALVLGLVFGGLWFDGRLTQISDDNKEMSGQLAAAVETDTGLSQKVEEMNVRLADAEERDASVMEVVQSQRAITYEALRMSATPGTSVKMLWGSEPSPSARGMVVVSSTGVQGLLLVLDLPRLPSDQVYQVWLMKNGQRYSAGVFTVDSTGYGQAVIIPVMPFAEFRGIRVHVAPPGGSPLPEGTSILKGDF